MALKRRWVWALLVALVSGMCMCPNLDSESFARVRPEVGALSGRYTPTSETLRQIGAQGYPAAEIAVVLQPDGVLLLCNLPDGWRSSSGEPAGGLDTGRGHWRLVQQQERWVLELDVEELVNSVSGPVQGRLTWAPLVGEQAPYFLWLYVGDPDSGNVMVFERTGE